MRYTGFQTNVDDHMVYAAWTWQAAHGALTFDDRFAVDPQPGLTFHLYFFLLGQIARVTGVVAAMTLARVIFSGLFLLLLARLVRRVRPTIYGTKLILASAVVAGGLGFLPNFWHRFGDQGPIDIWQPEGFVVPSMLTNGLFMVSLCLILAVFLSVLQVRRKGAAAVIQGVLAMGALMNIHSYDALLVGLVLLGFLAASLVARQMTLGWALRATLIVLGAVPAALWFIHVLHEDPVFAARAATETYSPNFRQVFLGYLPPIVLAFIGLYRRAANSGAHKSRRLAGLTLAGATLLGLLVLSAGHTGGYFLSPPGWAVAFVAAVAATALLAERSPTRNLIVAWALVGTVAIYFPALFQRKLTMGLSIPWAFLAGLALVDLIQHKERSARNLATILGLLVLGATSFFWTFRELGYALANVSSTTRHPVYLSPDVQRIVDYLERQPGRQIVVTWPGAANPAVDASGHPIPDMFQTPTIPDVAPFLTGLAGAYTYAGHWSETPDYGSRVRDSYRFLLGAPLQNLQPMTDEERQAFIQRWGVTYAVIPVVGGLPTVDPKSLGEVVVDGSQFRLVKIGTPGN
jgi:arabinosyltransferase C